jgi:hypothetical protein
MLKKLIALILTLALISNMIFFGMGKLEVAIFWFNIMVLGGISYWFYREKK